jgi:hypothetical protein
MTRALRTGAALLAALVSCACQSPTDPNTTTDFIDSTVSPDPANAAGPTGRFYTIKGDSNTPDQTLEYDWHSSFTVRVTLNEHATDKNVDVSFPVKITAATLRVQQASGGIITPPTGGDVEHYDFVSQASSNKFAAVGSSVNIAFEVWYDLPSLRKEALISVTLSFADADGVTFTEVVEVNVAP